jgi:hypothetical protein
MLISPTKYLIYLCPEPFHEVGYYRYRSCRLFPVISGKAVYNSMEPKEIQYSNDKQTVLLHSMYPPPVLLCLQTGHSSVPNLNYKTV